MMTVLAKPSHHTGVLEPTAGDRWDLGKVSGGENTQASDTLPPGVLVLFTNPHGKKEVPVCIYIRS